MISYSKPTEADIPEIYNLVCSSVRYYDTSLVVAIRGTLSTSCIARDCKTLELVGYVALSDMLKFERLYTTIGRELGAIDAWQELSFLVVKDTYRKSGVGTQLLSFCLEFTNRNLIYVAWGDSNSAFANRALENNNFVLHTALEGFLPKQGECVNCVYADACSREDCFSYVYYRMGTSIESKDAKNIEVTVTLGFKMNEDEDEGCFEVTPLPASDAMCNF